MGRHIALSCVLIVGLVGPRAYAQLPPQFVLEWGEFGTANGRFNEPYALTTDASGNVYVSDTVNHRIQKFDANGGFIRMWGSFGTAPGQFKDPVGLTVDASGDVYVAEFSGDRVQKFDSNGTFLDMWGSTGAGPGQFRTADDVCVDAAGDVFVVDKNNHRVQKFEPDGTFIREWGAFGTGPGQFKFPVGVKCDAAGNVYVAEQGGNRIQKFDGDGNLLDAWGSPGSAPGQFNEPIHIDIDANDLVFVPDSKNHRIQVFDSDGNFLAQWGTYGSGPGQFHEPEGVAAAGNGIVYVADTQNHRIQKFAGGGCSDCPPLPPPNTAQFEIGPPVPQGGDTFEVALTVDTAEMITFSQMTVEYDDACLSFVGATVGGDVANAGAIFISDAGGATDPTLNRHVLVQVTGEYGPGCGREVFVLTFDSLVGPASPCRIVWDRAIPASNPPNHLNTAGNVQIRFPAVTFCDLDGFDTRTTFRVGDPLIGPGSIEVPLLVTTDASITFTQMTIEYDSECLTFLNAVAGGGVTNPGAVTPTDFAGATDPLLDRHVTVNGTGEYGPGTDIEVYRLIFQFAGVTPPPCRLVWDRTDIPNPPNHLITTVPSQIGPDGIHFIDGVVSTGSCDDIQISGTVTYYENGTSIRPGIPDAISAAVVVDDCVSPLNEDVANAGAYSISFGNGPFAQICICAGRPKADCSGFEAGVVSGEDLILVQDFVAQLSTPTSRQKLAADLNDDDMLLQNDELGIKHWIAHAAVCTTDKCVGALTDNCVGTWRFVFPTGPGVDDFERDTRCLTSVCSDQTVDIEGILVGDVDSSWPNIFPVTSPDGIQSKPSGVALSLQVSGWERDVVTLTLSAALEPGATLHHVIYSLDWDARAFEYLGADAAGRARDWGLFDNAAAPGVTHGIVHRLAGMEPIRAPGEVAAFRFRARGLGAASRFSFSHLAANDVAVRGVAVDASASPRQSSAVPARYELTAYPNPFNPSTRVQFAIPARTGAAPVSVRVYDITGRLVRILLEGDRQPGSYEVVWNGADDQGARVGSGIYLVHCTVADWSAVQRVALVK